jgi:hypothetical protein
MNRTISPLEADARRTELLLSSGCVVSYPCDPGVGVSRSRGRSDGDDAFAQRIYGGNTFTAAAIVTIVIAAITALLAYPLGRGSSAVRWLVCIVAGVEVAGSVFALARFAGRRAAMRSSRS